ncbi:MAG: TIGR00374 family protein, partial [Cellulomonadaceae bacterium]|nr:TIGR00374 family protein [Cellulomonadaceae bacterium]
MSTPQTSALKAILFPSTSTSTSAGVHIVDIPEPRLHHPSNVLKMAAAALGIGLVLLVAVYAHSTTIGVSEDFIRFTGPLATFLTIPVNFLEGVLSIFVPLAVLIELAFQRQARQAVESIGAALVAFAVGWAVSWLITSVGSATLVAGLSVRVAVHPEAWRLSIPPYLSAITALLIVAGPSSRRATVRWAWPLLIVTIFALVITSQV